MQLEADLHSKNRAAYYGWNNRQGATSIDKIGEVQLFDEIGEGHYEKKGAFSAIYLPNFGNDIVSKFFFYFR